MISRKLDLVIKDTCVSISERLNVASMKAEHQNERISRSLIKAESQMFVSKVRGNFSWEVSHKIFSQGNDYRHFGHFIGFTL